METESQLPSHDFEHTCELISTPGNINQRCTCRVAMVSFLKSFESTMRGKKAGSPEQFAALADLLPWAIELMKHGSR